MTPQLQSIGAPYLGNAAFTLRTTQAPANTVGMFLLGLGRDETPLAAGCSLWAVSMRAHGEPDDDRRRDRATCGDALQTCCIRRSAPADGRATVSEPPSPGRREDR